MNFLEWVKDIFVEMFGEQFKEPMAKDGLLASVPFDNFELTEIHLKYQDFWDYITLQSFQARSYQYAIKTILENTLRYKEAEKLTGVAWEIIAVIHFRESSCNFDRQLLNGQRWKRKTTIVPKNYGPWPSWEASCIDAFTRHPMNNAFHMGELLDRLERYNGLGYRNRGYVSPYVFSGTQLYNKGLYVADGQFDPNKKDARVGVAILLKGLGFEQESQYSECH